VNLKAALTRAVRFAGLRVLLAVERLRSGVAFDPFDKRLFTDPYTIYRELRQRDPVHRSRLDDMWVLTRYADVLSVLTDKRFSADDRNSRMSGRGRRELMAEGQLQQEDFEPSMLRLDPPDHTRLRSLVTRAFTPRAVEALRPRVEEIVQEHLDTVAARGRMDVIRDLAYPLPVIVIAEMLGIPTEDRERFKHWSDEVVRTLGIVSSPEDVRRSMQAGRELRQYLEAIAAERRASPREDLLSALLAAEEAGDKLSTEEVFSTVQLLLIAGNETTTNLIGNGLLALMRHPDAMAELRADPSLMENAVEELLRYDSPVQMTSRVPTEDVEVDGKVLPRGTVVLLLTGAANRDPAQFTEPDRLDIHRQDIRHLSFGQGIHYCLGAPLARLEAPIALNALLQRFPDIRLDPADHLEWGDNTVLRGLRRLPVVF
jgi:pimeloyl-[acyl-carrier protein] synthase